MPLTDATILITGAGGLLGPRLVEHFARLCRVVAHYHTLPADAPVTPYFAGDLGEESHITAMVAELQPTIILNAAALADVDRCETHPDESRHINVEAVQHLLRHFPKATFVHISTDYLFDGSKRAAPDDVPAPINVYGRHKLEAERLVLAGEERNLVIRTNTTYDDSGRRNLFGYVFDNLKARKSIKGLTDQSSNPIAAFSSAEVIAGLVERHAAGVFHIGGAEFVSRYEFADRIADCFGFDRGLIEPVTSEMLPRPAARPFLAGLDCRRTKTFLDRPMPSLDDDFDVIKKRLKP